MTPRADRPTLPQGAIELAQLGTRPAFVRQLTSPTQAAEAMPSPPKLVARRTGELATGLRLARPGPRPTQTSAHSPLSTGHSGRSVQFAEAFDTPAGSTAAERLLRRPVPKLFGIETNYRPLWLLGLGNSGSALFGIGEVLVARAAFPSRAYDGTVGEGVVAIPGGAAGPGTAFGGPMQGIIGGSILMALGVSAAMTASILYVQDGRALNRRQNPMRPNYTRTHAYFAAHQLGIFLLISHRFALEGFRVALPPSFLWAGTIPGAFGQALFAITQAQSFSSSEVYHGKIPLKHRAEISMAARAGISFYVIVAGIVATPNSSAYWREIIRLIAQTSTALAYSLPLTTARIAAPFPRLEAGELRPRGSFTALQSFGVYALARVINSIAATQLQHSAWPGIKPPAGPLENPQTGWLGLPVPWPTGDDDPDYVAFAALMLTLSVGMSWYSFLQFRQDAIQQQGRRYANTMVGMAFACIVLGSIWRSLGESAKERADFRMIWIAAPFGFFANALAFIAIPEMFGCSEVQRGQGEIPYRYQVTEACRGFGNLFWTLWAATAATLGFPPILRQAFVWSASLLSLLGTSLPTAETRRSQIGSNTPAQELPSYFGPR